jgi:hypothetical protein
VLITQSPEVGWGIDGHANTSADIVASARAALAGKKWRANPLPSQRMNLPPPLAGEGRVGAFTTLW